MSSRLIIDGLQEMLTALRNLPEDLTAEAGSIVRNHAERAFNEIEGNYQRHEKTGELANKLEVKMEAEGRFGVSAVLRSKSKLASIFEHGTRARHIATGADRGTMPAAHAFIPSMVRARRAMYEDLASLLRRNGFEVINV